ncbi:MAG: hypothetical protein HeimC3_24350 [Candidatus Heimdallarchaeota archaeon LC_3]|nr:MAG: hypothetical protein HeimC3_24350 [Candidatus Heimdallarchaeota archaeon LC_3]
MLKRKKNAKLTGLSLQTILVILILFTLYASYYFLAIKDMRLAGMGSDLFWPDTCARSLFPFPTKYGVICGQALTEMTDQNKFVYNNFIKNGLYILVMIFSWIITAFGLVKYYLWIKGRGTLIPLIFFVFLNTIL